MARSFWPLWWATLVSSTGDGIRIVALPLFAASLTRDPGAVSVVTVVGGLPWLLVGPFTGALTDRLRDYRRVMWVTDLCSAVGIGLFGVIAATGGGTIAMLAGVNFLLGSIQTLRDGVTLSAVPRIVPKEGLETANSRLQAAQLITMELVGPPLGAVLFSLPTGAPFLIDAASFVLSAAIVLGIADARLRAQRAVLDATGPADSPDAPVAVPRGNLLQDVRHGMAWLWKHPLLRAVCLLVGLTNFAVMAVLAIAILYAYEVLHVSHLAYGLLLGLVAVGGLVGTLAAPVLTERFGRGTLLRAVFAVSSAAFVVAGLTSTPLLAAGSLSLVGAGVGVANVVSVSLRQALVPEELMGRVNSAYRFFAVGLGPVGAALSGASAELWGLRAPFILAAVVLAAGWLVALRTLRPSVIRRHLPQDGLRRAPASTTAE
ncbi:MFS transporter [Kitasatospora sp. NPDC096147]|uniref:MFS transporter n=1 Tax=Kitasatospora sp. NPDC096147 TaxID=3364093 RepID=UPI00381B8681